MPADTVVLSDWGEGAFLMWRFPELDFVVSGYGDIYTDAELARNFRMDGTAPGWVSDAKGTGARYALLKTGSEARLRAADSRGLGGAAPQRHVRPARGPRRLADARLARPGPDMAEPRRSGVRRRGPQA